MFFSYLERCWKYGTFLRQIATASLQKALKNIANQQGIPGVLLAVGTCALVLKILTYHVPRLEEIQPITAWKRKMCPPSKYLVAK